MRTPPLHEEKCDEGAPLWVVTFGDMMSLLLTFFILLVSFAQIEIVKYTVFSGSVLQAFGVQTVRPLFDVPRGHDVSAAEFTVAFSPEQLFSSLNAATSRHQQRMPSGRVDIEVFEDYRGLVLRIGEEAMFESGRAEVRPSIWPFLDDVIEIALENRAQLQIEAHTDSAPIRTLEFPSNDHLSAARALSVVEYVTGRVPDFPATRIEAAPLGATRPIAPDVTSAGRQRNRRIEIVFQETPSVKERPEEAPPP